MDVYGWTRLQCFFRLETKSATNRLDCCPSAQKGETFWYWQNLPRQFKDTKLHLPPQMIQAKQLSMEEWHHKALVDWVPILLLHLHLGRELFSSKGVFCPPLW